MQSKENNINSSSKKEGDDTIVETPEIIKQSYSPKKD